MPTTVAYYITKRGRNPVYDFINSLTRSQQSKLYRILTLAEQYDLNHICPYIKKLTSTRLWEIKKSKPPKIGWPIGSKGIQLGLENEVIYDIIYE
jgi:hypothetical protein